MIRLFSSAVLLLTTPVVAEPLSSVSGNVASKDYITAACFDAKVQQYEGITVFQDGSIFHWASDKNGTQRFKNQIGKDKQQVKKLFILGKKQFWDAKEFPCTPSGKEDFCYWQEVTGKNVQEFKWSVDNVLAGVCVLPEKIKNIYNLTVTIGAKAMEVTPVKMEY